MRDVAVFITMSLLFAGVLLYALSHSLFPSCIMPCAGDCNYDCQIDGKELAIALTIAKHHPDQLGYCHTIDSNQDMIVSIQELKQIGHNWRYGCPKDKDGV